MNTSLKKVALLALLSFSLVSCDNPFRFVSSTNEYSGNTLNPDLDLTNNENPYANGRDYFTKMNSQTSHVCPSTGNRKLLIVPVAFKDYDYNKLYGDDNEIKLNLNEIFFSNSNSYYESVSSYYYKSSYGNLSFSGTITDVFQLDNTFKYYDELEETTATTEISSEIANYYGYTYLKNFDTTDDDDSYIDGLWMVYLYPQNSENTLQWAFTYHNTESKYVNTFSWAAYDFAYTKKTNTYNDAHTFIHETGHMLGLDDYYSYDDEDSPRSPTGLLDMMDGNILDHSSFSKYCLGWIDPIVVKANKEYTLKPFESSGDSLIIAANFNGTCFDEYFIVEYYTPTGLNQLDSSTNYQNKYPLGFTINGLKILHVDQRVAKINIDVNSGEMTWNGQAVDNPTPNIPTLSKPYFYTVISSNSKCYCLLNEEYTLVNLVQADGSDNLLHPTVSLGREYAMNLDLFTRKSNVFGKDVYNDYITNEGWKLPYSLTITSQSDSQITVKIESI